MVPGSATNDSIHVTNNSTCVKDVHAALIAVGSVGVIIIISITGIIANIIGIAAIKTAIREFRPVHNFLLNLSIADICVCVSGLTMHILNFLQCSTVKNNVYRVVMAFMPISVLGQAGCLLLLALDHYLVIVYPLRCQVLLNRQRSYIVISAQWCVAIVCHSVYAACSYPLPPLQSPYDFSNYCTDEAKINAIYFMIIFLIMFALYVRVFMEIHRMPNLALSGVNKQQNKKAIKTTLMILGTYFLLMGPQWTTTIVLQGLGLVREKGYIFVFLNCLMILNCSCDPLIYSMRMQDVRRGFNKICSLCRYRRNRTTPIGRHQQPPVNQ